LKYTGFLLIIIMAGVLLNSCEKADFPLGISAGNGSLNASQELSEIYYPVNISNLNLSLLDTNFTAFITQTFTQFNTSAYGQGNTAPCYRLTNNGTRNITVRVRATANSTTYIQKLVVGNDNITGSPSLTLTTSFQDFFNLTINETKNVSCFGDYNNAVLNETFNTSIVWNLTVI